MNKKMIGAVTSGRKIGRGLGFPTANIPLGDGDPVRDGVWAGRVEVRDATYPAIINIGRNPTVNERGPRMLEAHLFGFGGDIYGETVEVELLKFIRPERKLASLEELRRQIMEDKDAVEKYFANTGGDSKDIL